MSVRLGRIRSSNVLAGWSRKWKCIKRLPAGWEDWTTFELRRSLWRERLGSLMSDGARQLVARLFDFKSVPSVESQVWVTVRA